MWPRREKSFASTARTVWGCFSDMARALTDDGFCLPIANDEGLFDESENKLHLIDIQNMLYLTVV
jgi:hypothetical protein